MAKVMLDPDGPGITFAGFEVTSPHVKNRASAPLKHCVII